MLKPRILIVEDDSDLSEMLETFFGSQDYEVVTAIWGSDALQLAREQMFNLIMLDIRLPDISGYEICQQLRSQRRTQDVPVLFLTEKRERDARLQGLELGVVDYITKPFDIQEVGLRVRNVLARAAQPVNTHRVTDLPEGELVNERLMTMLYSPEAWAVVAFELRGIDAFRERFGFVAADDVLRALALMMRNAVREQGSDDDFIGHLEHDVFVIITHAASAAGIRERVQTKMHYSREFFYPLQVRASGGALIIDEDEQIDVDAAIIGPHTGHTDVQSLRAAIHTALSIA